jgi:hypothetical protein
MSWMDTYARVCSTSPRMGSLEMLLNWRWSRETTKESNRSRSSKTGASSSLTNDSGMGSSKYLKGKEFPMTLTKRTLIVFLIHRRDWLSADGAHMMLWVLGCLW